MPPRCDRTRRACESIAARLSGSAKNITAKRAERPYNNGTWTPAADRWSAVPDAQRGAYLTQHRVSREGRIQPRWPAGFQRSVKRRSGSMMAPRRPASQPAPQGPPMPRCRRCSSGLAISSPVRHPINCSPRVTQPPVALLRSDASPDATPNTKSPDAPLGPTPELVLYNPRGGLDESSTEGSTDRRL